MPKSSTRYSHRHLLALGTFLIPLMVLAALGWRELQRSGAMTEASLDREAQQFLARAQAAIAQRIELQVPTALAASERLLVDDTATRAALRLREVEGIPSVLDILLINEQADLVWPALPTYSVSLPLAVEPKDPKDGRRLPALSTAETLIQHGQLQPAIQLLEELIQGLLKANPPNEDGSRQRPDLLEAEVHARFRLGSALRAIGETMAARMQFQQVESLARNDLWRRRRSADMPAFQLVAQGVLAELGPAGDRIDLLRRIAEGEFRSVADGLAGAIAQRMADTFNNDDPRLEDIERYLREDAQRAATRQFAGTYALWFSYIFRMRLRPQQPSQPQAIADEFIVSTIDDYTSLLAIRPATTDENRREQCDYVAVHFNLNELIEPALGFIAPQANYSLSITDPDGVVLRAPPTSAPEDFVAPTAKTNGLTLRVYPADPARLLAEANSAANKRMLLVVALLVTALGGALWSWRSVSREAELAALKIELVSRVSHELQTPLALIRMYGETISMGRVRDGDQASEFGSIIARESERLTTLIQRILDFSRQQAGTLTYATEPHDIGELLRATAYAYAPHLEEKGVVLIDSLPLGIIVTCDKDGLEGAIINLLENATKYGHADVQDHEVDLLLQKVDGDAVIEVRDRGRGIPDGEHRRIFEGFYRATNSGEVRGAGLGLGIVQHFSRAHDGEIEAIPREGGGTIMRLTLPLANQTPPLPYHPSPNNPNNRNTGTPT